MKSIDTLFNRWCGAMAILAGSLTAIFWFLHPDPSLSDLQATKSAMWPVSHAIFLATLIGTLFALNGFLKIAFEKIGVVGFIGYVLATVGTALFIGAGLFDGFIKPPIVASESSDALALLAPKGPIEMALVPIFAPGGLIFAGGFMLIGLQIIRTKVLPVWVGALFLLTFILGLSPMMPVPVRMFGCGAFGAAMIMVGIHLWNASTGPPPAD